MLAIESLVVALRNGDDRIHDLVVRASKVLELSQGWMLAVFQLTLPRPEVRERNGGDCVFFRPSRPIRHKVENREEQNGNRNYAEHNAYAQTGASDKNVHVSLSERKAARTNRQNHDSSQKSIVSSRVQIAHLTMHRHHLIGHSLLPRKLIRRFDRDVLGALWRTISSIHDVLLGASKLTNI